MLNPKSHLFFFYICFANFPYDPTLHDYCHNFHVDCPFVLSSYFHGLVLSFNMSYFEAQRELKRP